MGEILGIGTTHYPGLTGTDEGLSSTWQVIINAPHPNPVPASKHTRRTGNPMAPAALLLPE